MALTVPTEFLKRLYWGTVNFLAICDAEGFNQLG